MGLDMYAFKIRKITDEEKEVLEASMPKSHPDDIFLFPVPEQGTENYEMLKDLKEYATTMNLPQTYINMAKIREDNNIPEEAVIGGTIYGAKSITYDFYFGKGNASSRSVELTREEIEENYLFDQQEDFWVVHAEECGYWRKHYRLEDDLYELYDGTIYNCGYHKCNEKMLALLADDGGICTYTDEGEAIFYHEWY